MPRRRDGSTALGRLIVTLGAVSAIDVLAGG
jgi:hypothetical protein